MKYGETDMYNIKINFFRAFWGDSFLLVFNNDERTTFLIDGGVKRAFRDNMIGIIKQEYSKSNNNYIFLTHIDDDHVGGIQFLFERLIDLTNNVKSVIFNTFDFLSKFTSNVKAPLSVYINDEEGGFTSYRQGMRLENKLEEIGINLISNIIAGKQICLDGIQVTFLSPSAESLEKYESWVDVQQAAYTAAQRNDYMEPLERLNDNLFYQDESPTNASSLSLLIEFKDKKMLFLGDSIPSDVVSTLNKLGYSNKNKLNLDVVKVSHHGSKQNTSKEFLEMITCDKFLISTDGRRHGHPDKEALARIIYSQNCPELIFNYDIYNGIFSKEELQSGLFTVKLLEEVVL